VARGRTNGEIADELHITLSTVKTHVTSLMTKLGARNRVETAIWAYETNRVRNGTAAEPRPAESTAPRSAVRPVRLRPFYR
jgi:predicted transcriptional regulator